MTSLPATGGFVTQSWLAGGKQMLSDPAARQGFEQQLGRLVPTLIGELEDAPVNANRADGFEVLQDLHGFVGIGVLRTHEPARRIGADRDQSQIGPTDASPHLMEDAPVAIAGVARKISATGTGAQHEARPERHAPITSGTR